MALWPCEHGDVATVGASGLIFGYFGHVVVRGLFDRHLIDTPIGLVMGASFAYLLTVAVPGAPGVSWLSHLGGLLGGLVGAWLFRDRRAPTCTRNWTTSACSDRPGVRPGSRPGGDGPVPGRRRGSPERP